MLNEFNTATAAEAIKMIAEGCLSFCKVAKNENFKSVDEAEKKAILFHLEQVARANDYLSKALLRIGSNIDTKAF